jgi:predicted permease
METWLQDARYAVRTLVRSPGFTVAGLVTLMLGIGANTAIFSVVNAVLLRPLPYPEPDRIVQLVRVTQDGEQLGQTGQRYLFFRDHMRSVEALAAWRDPTGYNLSTGTTAEYVKAMPVSKEFFDVFGVRPVHGTPFAPEHDRTGGPDVVILSHGLWLRVFAGNPAAVGSVLSLGDRACTIVGIMPREFASIPPADLYVPLRPGTTGPGGGFNYGVAGRVARGTTLANAKDEAAAIFAAFSAEHPQAVPSRERGATVVSYQASMSRNARPALLMLGAVGLLLLIACANTTSLLLARAAGRGREIAVRAALGAGRPRIVRQLLTESVILFAAGGLLGIAIAYWSVPLLLSLTPVGYTVFQDVRIDARVLAVMVAVTLATGLLFGLAPAASLARHDVSDAFKDDGTRATSSRGASWLRQSLVVCQIAICMLLLVGAGLLIQTFVRLRAVDAGFKVGSLLTARMSLQGDRYATTADLNRFFDDALERIRGLPGVQAASIVNGIPIERALNLNVDVLDLEGPERIERAGTDWRYASTNYFETMGIAVVAGRGFAETDRAGAPAVAVVSEEFARRYLKGRSAVGHHIRVYSSDGSIEIVGVVKNLREGSLRARPIPVMYVPITQANIAGIRASHTYFPMSWVVRSARPGPELSAAIREVVHQVDPRLPFSAFATMDDVKAGSMRDETFQMSLVASLAAIGLALAVAGIYGLVSYSVTQRTRELGIRMALGASRSRIVRSVVRQGVVMAIAGVSIGLVAAYGLARLLRNFVFGVSPQDPMTLAGVAVVLFAVAVGASLVPAVRAIRLNPMSALRK